MKDKKRRRSKDRTTGEKSAYTDQRLAEISEGLKAWIKEFGRGGQTKASRTLEAARTTICGWLDRKTGPSPKFMFILWQQTGKDVFLLSREEREIWISRGYSIPEDFPAKGDVEEGKTSAKKLNVQHVFSDERLKEIARATGEWYATLPTPKEEEVPKRIKVNRRYIYNLRKAKVEPYPIVMHRLWLQVKNPVFLFTEEERRKFKEQGFEIPRDFPVKPDFPETVEKKIKEEKPTEEKKLENPERTANDFLISYLSGFRGVEDVVRLINEIPEDMKKKAVDLVIRIIKTFKLEIQDFKQAIPQIESDPKKIRTIERALGLANDLDKGGEE